MNQSGQPFRQQVAALLDAVADEQVAPQVAINRWPVPQGHQDASLDCAFWALWHFEADEAQQQSELYYMDTQLELLRQMAGFLGQGRDLPPYMLAGYGDHPAVRFYYAHSPWLDYWQRVSERWQRFTILWEQAVLFLPGQSVRKP
jgi:hypothetical protein